MFTPYVTIASIPEFSRNKTGFGYMVLDIAQSVGDIENVEVIATDTRGAAFDYGRVKFLKRTILGYFFNILYCLSPMSVIRLWLKYRMSIGAFVRLIYYWMMTGYVRSVINKGQYDIVHIHGCNFATDLWMQVCNKCLQKYIVTLHGLNSFSDSVALEQAGKKYERDFLKRVVAKEFPITVISTGIKRLIENTFNLKECKNVYVVCNSFSFSKINKNSWVDIRQKYKINSNAFIVLYIGNVGIRKNQGQFIRAFEMLPSHLVAKTYVLFLGSENEEGYSIKELTKESQYKDHFIACGFVEKELVPLYYEQGNAVALMSLSEGFGLSLIEGLHFGLPCMSFTDVDAFEDIFDYSVMVGVEEHNDEAVARGLEHLITNNWNKDKIKEYSKKFEAENMANKYIEVYNHI